MKGGSFRFALGEPRQRTEWSKTIKLMRLPLKVLTVLPSPSFFPSQREGALPRRQTRKGKGEKKGRQAVWPTPREAFCPH